MTNIFKKYTINIELSLYETDNITNIINNITKLLDNENITHNITYNLNDNITNKKHDYNIYWILLLILIITMCIIGFRNCIVNNFIKETNENNNEEKT